MVISSRIRIVQGDITQMKVDAIVNAANNSLLGGGGVDGAIHRAAGPELLQACKEIGGCATGDAVLTKGFKLDAHFVIHTVGPVWKGGHQHENNLLAAAYKNSLAIAAAQNAREIAFPNISTGIYGFPKERAAQIAIKTVTDFLQENISPQIVHFVCFDQENYLLYKSLL